MDTGESRTDLAARVIHILILGCDFFFRGTGSDAADWVTRGDMNQLGPRGINALGGPLDWALQTRMGKIVFMSEDNRLLPLFSSTFSSSVVESLLI